MNQKEKSQLSKDKILNAALTEFGTKTYENASLNNICNDNGISKGLIYHYFQNKDALYLTCIATCFDALTNFINKGECHYTDFQRDMKKYIDLRHDFFNENPLYSNIFFNVVLQAPKHLKEEIKELRKDFDALNRSHYEAALGKITLRDDISKEEAMNFFFIFQEMFNGYYQQKAHENTDFKTLIQDHELGLSKILNIMLYGIAKERIEQ